MNKIKLVVENCDRNREVINVDASISCMITPLSIVTSLHKLPSNPLVEHPARHTFTLPSHHEMKNFSKSARPIAPAPPPSVVQNLTSRNVQSSHVNIPSIVSTSNNDNIININLVATTTTCGLAVPATLSKANVLQQGLNTSVGNSSLFGQNISSSTLPVAMLKSSTTVGQQTQSQIPTFTSYFSHASRGAPSPVVPKPAGLKHQGTPPVLQTPTGLNALSLPLARAPLLPSIKTVPITKSPISAAGSQTGPQTQPQDLSRTSFAMHGSITSVTSGNHIPTTMQAPSSKSNAPANQDGPSRAGSSYIHNDIPANNVQQRISVSLSSDSSLRPRLTTDLNKSTLPFAGSVKFSHPILGCTAKIITARQSVPVKPLSIAVTAPIVINTINHLPSTPVTSAASSAAPIPIAKVTPQRQIPVGTILSSSTSSLQSFAASSTCTQPVPNTSMPVFSLPSSTSCVSTSMMANVTEAISLRQEQTSISSTQSSPSSILIASDFQPRPPGSILGMTTLTPSVQGGPAPLVISQADNRSSTQNQQQIDVKPGDPMWLQHCVFQAQNSLLPQPAQIIRPGTNTFPFLSSQGTLLSRAAGASSIYPVSGSVQTQLSGGAAGGGGSNANAVREVLNAVPVSNANSSPRPSILRKRPSEGTGVVRKPIFNLNQETRCLSPPRVDTSPAIMCSPKNSNKNLSPVSENSQSSTDTALSSNDATTPTYNHMDRRKIGTEQSAENGPVSSISIANNIQASPTVSHLGNHLESSPRKRARKQLLHVSEELKDKATTSEDEQENNTYLQDSPRDNTYKDREISGEYTDNEGVRWVLNKPKPTYVLLQPDLIANKSKNNHFTRYSDVNAKEERWPTVNELSNQRGIMQKVNGWKLYFSASHLEELMEVEKEMQEQFAEVQAALDQIPTHKINSQETLKLHEMSQANIQRCQFIHSQLTDARATMIRTLDHKQRIHEIVSKHMSKRPIKKKERT